MKNANVKVQPRGFHGRFKRAPGRPRSWKQVNKRWFKALPFWKRAERTIAQQLRLHDVPCTLISGQNLPWDITTATGLKIECKAARLCRGRRKTHLIRAP